MTRTRRATWLALLIVTTSVGLSAQQTWIWSRDDNSQPIKLTSDAISLVLLESRVPSGNNFLANDSQVGLLIDTHFAGSTADEPQATRDFPFMFEETADFMNDPNHPHSKILSKQQALIDYFPLTDGKVVYRSITIDISLLRKQDPAVWTKVLDSFLTATKDVSLPSPLTVGVNYLSKFSTDVLHQYLPDPNKDKRLDFGSFSFLLANSPTSLNRITSTGLHLRLLQPTGSGDGWVDPSHWDSYCFYTKFDQSNWAVYVAKKDSTAADKDAFGCPKSKYTQLMNDYIPILIEAEQTPAHGGNLALRLQELGMGAGNEGVQRLSERADDLHKAALAQCNAYRVQQANCPAMRSRP